MEQTKIVSEKEFLLKLNKAKVKGILSAGKLTTEDSSTKWDDVDFFNKGNSTLYYHRHYDFNGKPEDERKCEITFSGHTKVLQMFIDMKLF